MNGAASGTIERLQRVGIVGRVYDCMKVYYITQEQYEQLRGYGISLEVIETIAAFDKLIDLIGNQPLPDSDGPAAIQA
jgi:hypothetical protein